jgi:hypothetical protein
VLGLAVTIGIGVLHLLWSRLGYRPDVGGSSGSFALGVFSLVFVLPAVVVGGAIGAFISSVHADG